MGCLDVKIECISEELEVEITSIDGIEVYASLVCTPVYPADYNNDFNNDFDI